MDQQEFEDKYVNKIICSDCLEVMADWPDNCIQCCVTSPPYWGLRDYGHNGQLGLEKTPEEYVDKMVRVFQEVKRVLKDDGTLWLNLGDSYNGSGHKDIQINSPKQMTSRGARSQRGTQVVTLKPKDIVGIPWRVAFALQKDGWYLRQDIIWHKPNPMPESVTDRCTKAHEYIFLFTKSARYYYNAKAIAEPWTSGRNDMRAHGVRTGAAYIQQGNVMDNSNRGPRKAERNEHDYRGGRNKRSVWTVPLHPFPDAHFATFPPKLIEPCILAGSRKGDIVLDTFMGAGTTAIVALKHKRNYVGSEINQGYCEIARKRLEAVETGVPVKEAEKGQMALFSRAGQ